MLGAINRTSWRIPTEMELSRRTKIDPQQLFRGPETGFTGQKSAMPNTVISTRKPLDTAPTAHQEKIITKREAAAPANPTTGGNPDSRNGLVSRFQTDKPT